MTDLPSTPDEFNDMLLEAISEGVTFCMATRHVEGYPLPFVCTREHGHEGAHVAHGGDDGEELHRWMPR